MAQAARRVPGVTTPLSPLQGIVKLTPHPRKAVILAAGLGTRLEPLTYDTPKPLVPLWGESLISRLVRLLGRWGVRDILVNLHHEPGSIVRELRGKDGPRVCFSFEPAILGTGGVLERASWFLDKDPVWMINADIVAELTPAPLVRALAGNRTIASLWLHPGQGPRTVEMRRGQITCFRSEHPGAPGTFTFCGLQLLSPEILSFLPVSGTGSIVTAYEDAMKAGHCVRGVVVEGSHWADVGTPHRYLEAHATGVAGRGAASRRSLQSPASLRKRGVAVQGFAAVAQDASVSPGAEIVNSVVWSGARIGPRARLADAVVARDTPVNRRLSGIAIACDRFPEKHAVRAALVALRWSPEKATALRLPARGSDRWFTRLVHGTRTAMLIRYDPARKENTRYAGHARFLAKKRVPVPLVLRDLPDVCATVVEDVGDRSLEDHAGNQDLARIERIYRKVIDAAVTLHGIDAEDLRRAGIRLEPPFTPSLYQWEHELFTDHFLARAPGIGKRTIRNVEEELRVVGRKLGRAPRMLIHRDLQSSNVMLRRGQPVFIDFQGMRMGPAAYDLASLLCDPYMALPESLQASLLQYYASRSEIAEEVSRVFAYAAVQRLVQAIGAYGRFECRPETAHFGRHIGPAFMMMRRALDELESFDALRKLSDRFASQNRRGGTKA